jgi:ParB/RepB/Spo0J family partition protein
VHELELHQLDRRYEALRRREPRREARLLASLSEHGQQIPIIVVGEHVVVDGSKRVRALAKLAPDTVAVVAWSIDEREALLLGRVLRTAEEDALEQGWLLCELRDRFAMTPSVMAARFDKSESWVSRRLALVGDLPREVQDLVRAGALGAHAAMKYFVPLARANVDA